MGNTNCRYVINALGKSGETYYTHCQDKQELKKWLAEHQEKVEMNGLKIVDKRKNPFVKLFSIKG